jgi:hypothetical protein
MRESCQSRHEVVTVDERTTYGFRDPRALRRIGDDAVGFRGRFTEM